MKKILLWLSTLLLIICLGSCSSLDSVKTRSVAASPEQDKSGWLENTVDKLGDRIQTKLGSLTEEVGLSLFSQDVLTGINASLRYTYETESSESSPYYTRADRWKIATEIRAGDLLSEVAGDFSPIYLNLKAGEEIVLVRHYKKERDAQLALPWTPFRLPLTAKSAREHLKPGDFVAIPTELNLLLGASCGIPFFSPSYLSLTAKMEASYLVSSQFQLQVMKLANERVQIRLIALKKNRASATAGLEWGIDIFRLPGIKDLNINFSNGVGIKNKTINNWTKGAVEKLPSTINEGIADILDRDIIKVGMSATNGKLFEIDYTFNLNDPIAAEAYTHLMGSTYRFKRLKLFKEITKDKEDHELFVTDLDSIEQIVSEDKDKPDEEKRISREFKGQNEFEGTGKNLKYGLVFFHNTRSSSSFNDLLTYFTPENSAENLVYLNNSKMRGSTYIFNLKKEHEYWNNFVMHKSNSSGDLIPGGFIDIGSDYLLKDKSLRLPEQRALQKSLAANLPFTIFKEIPWDKVITEAKQKNAKISLQIFFNKNIIQMMKTMTKEEIYRRLDIFNLHGKLIDEKEKVELAKNLEDCFIYVDENSVGSNERLQRFMKLQRTKLFEKYGLRLLFSFIDEAQLEESVYLHLTWSSNIVEPVEYSFGSNPRSEFLPILQRMQIIIDQSRFDIRLVQYKPKKD